MPPTSTSERSEIQLAPVHLPAGSAELAAAGAANSYDPTTGEFEALISSGAAMPRGGFFEKPWILQLSQEPGSLITRRLDNGAPVVTDHRTSTSNQVGRLVAGSARQDGARTTVRVKLALTDDTADLRAKVEQGILTSFSPGVLLRQMRELTGTELKKARELAGYAADADIPARLATQWELYELSFVPVDADGATALLSATEQLAPCELLSATSTEVAVPVPQTETMTPKPTQGAAGGETLANVEPTKPTETRIENREPHTLFAGWEADELSEALGRTVDVFETPSAEDGQALEAFRRDQLTQAGAANGLDRAAIDAILTSTKNPAAGRKALLAALAERSDVQESITPTQRTTGLELGRTDRDKVKLGVENAITHTLGLPSATPQAPSRSGVQAPAEPEALSDLGRGFVGMPLIETAKAVLRAEGIQHSHTPLDVAELALHTSSDFKEIAAGVINKSMRAAYEQTARTYRAIAYRDDASNFLPQNVVALGELALQKLEEGQEYRFQTIGTERESFRVVTRQGGITLSFEALVNDDIGAFSRLPQEFAEASQAAEEDAVWDLIVNNAVMADGLGLFHTSHGNLTTTAAALDSTGATLSEMRVQAARQTGIDGKQINVEPSTLVVPPELQTVAEQLTRSITAREAGNVNVWGTWIKQLVVANRLTDLTAHYLFAPGSSPRAALRYGFLRGAAGPRVSRMPMQRRNGIEYVCLHYFGAGVADYRGAYRHDGA